MSEDIILNKNFINPKLGIIIYKDKSSRDPLNITKEELKNIVGEDGIILEVFSEKDIYYALAEFKYYKIPIVCFVGDNRNLHILVYAMIDLLTDSKSNENLPIFLPLKCKNRNLIAGDVDLDKDIHNVISKIKKTYLHNKKDFDLKDIKYTERNSLKLTVEYIDIDNNNIKEMYYGFLVGIGAIYKIIKLDYEGDKNIKSLKKLYFSLLFNGKLSDHLLSKDKCIIKINGETIKNQRFVTILMSTLDYLVDNYRPFSGLIFDEKQKNISFNFIGADLNKADILKGLPFFTNGHYGKLEKEGKIILKRPSIVEIETHSGILLDGCLIKPYSDKYSYNIKIESGPIFKFPII